jgi:hypothetical protein
MSKYDPLQKYLRDEPSGIKEIAMTISHINTIVKLPPSALSHEEWWANENVDTTSHVQARSWQLAGWDAHPNLIRQIVTFYRKLP